MSKVICDVCGTTFPETANQCPICGSARNSSAQTGAGDGTIPMEEGNAYTYVKGGRFSKSNVRKRNKTGQPMQRHSGESPKKDNNKEGSNKGLVVVVVILLLAIIAVCVYIGIRFFAPEDKPNTPSYTTTTSPSATQKPSESQTEPDGIACTDIQLSSTIIEFTDKERSQLLSAILAPVDTTDKLIFTSMDTDIATVTDGGLVTPVGAGETIITVTCGDIQKECRVVCSFTDATQPSTESQEPTVTPGAFELIFNTKFVNSEGIGDVTLTAGTKWKMYASMNVEASKVIWTSENEEYVTISKEGVVTAVAPTGNLAAKYVLVHAEYGDVKYTCRIRVPGAAAPAETPETKPAETVEFEMTLNTIYFTSTGDGDVTLKTIGGTWKMYKSISVAADQVTWTTDDPAVATVSNGVVTAVAVGKTMVHAEYNGVKYSCVIHVG